MADEVERGVVESVVVTGECQSRLMRCAAFELVDGMAGLAEAGKYALTPWLRHLRCLCHTYRG